MNRYEQRFIAHFAGKNSKCNIEFDHKKFYSCDASCIYTLFHSIMW